MAANPIQPDPTIEYPEKWTPMQHKCACGTNVRVDVEFIAGMSAMQVFQHCAKDEGEYYPQIIAAWEERDMAMQCWSRPPNNHAAAGRGLALLAPAAERARFDVTISADASLRSHTNVWL